MDKDKLIMLKDFCLFIIKPFFVYVEHKKQRKRQET